MDPQARDEQQYGEVDVVLLYLENARKRAERAAADLRASGAEDFLVEALEHVQKDVSEAAKKLRQGTFFAVPELAADALGSSLLMRRAQLVGQGHDRAQRAKSRVQVEEVLAMAACVSREVVGLLGDDARVAVEVPDGGASQGCLLAIAQRPQIGHDPTVVSRSAAIDTRLCQ